MLEAETWRINNTPLSASRRKMASRPNTTRKEPAAASTSAAATSRLYLAPAASKTIRRIDSGTCAVDTKTASARRRRNVQPTFTRSPADPHTYESDNDSSDSLLDPLEAPCLWMNDDIEQPSQERLHRSFGSLEVSGRTSGASSSPIKPASNSMHTAPNRASKSKSKYHSRRRRYNKSKSDGSVRSEYNDCDDVSVYSYYTQTSVNNNACGLRAVDQRHSTPSDSDDDHSHTHTRKKANSSSLQMRKLQYVWNHTSFKWILLQLILVLAFVWVVHDAKQRQKLHQQQLQEYEEERAHILEQMTWIDAAAKKVHQKYSNTNGSGNILLHTAGDPSLPDDRLEHASKADLQAENQQVLQELEQVQHRVQQNARHRTAQYFGDRPVQVSLPLLQESDRHVVIALQDDAPHAVSTFLQQVNEKLWDEVDFQRLQNGRILQASTRFSETNPILEFAERSRGCHQVGGVAVHQLESTDFHVLVLKFHMEERTPMDEGDVCIGTIVSGLEELEQLIPTIPEIRSEEAVRYDGEEGVEYGGGETMGTT